MGGSVKSEQIRDGEIKRPDLNTNEPGQAVITKVISGNRILIDSSGVDDGTGDVTINVENQNYYTIERADPLMNQIDDFVNYVDFDFTVPTDKGGIHRIDWAYLWSLNDGAQDMIVSVFLDDTTELFIGGRQHRQEPSDVAGTGITVNVSGGGTQNTGTDNIHEAMNFRPAINLVPGAHNIKIRYRGSASFDRATLYGATIAVERKA